MLTAACWVQAWAALVSLPPPGIAIATPPVPSLAGARSFGFAPGAPPLRLVLSVYDLNGTWLGLRNWTGQLQVCGAPVGDADAWNRCGRAAVTWRSGFVASACRPARANLPHVTSGCSRRGLSAFA